MFKEMLKKCFWLFNHDFTKWEDYDKVESFRYNTSELPTKGELIQKRVCKKCGKVEFRSERIF